MSKIRVGVIYGGRSGEHEVSIRSAESIIAGLDPSRYHVTRYLIGKDGRWKPGPILPEPGRTDLDVVFPILHGTFGEDGTVQGLLELADLPYAGAGVMASAISMDKEMTKRVCRERGLPVVDYAVVTRGHLDAQAIAGRLPFPLFVKPANLGSSVGISKAHNQAGLAAALALAAQYDRKVIVERGVEGREFECSVIGNDHPAASVPCEIIPSREFYDYEDKYLLDKARVEMPARITPEQTAEMQRLAVSCYQAVECEGMARVDFLMDGATGQMFVNEINTLPGFTSISMFPKMWEHSGIKFPALIEQLLALAIERHQRKRETRYTR
ncbi:MAG: D-alanine--D-alanine ligase [Acidobacteriota bacterium]|nr:D-alanine--D-alanine ligase [Acidobacteriota bacterium]